MLGLSVKNELTGRLPGALRCPRDTDVLFPRLGRRRRDGAFPDAGPRYADGHRLDEGELSGRGLRDLLRPIQLDAGVPPALARPQILPHTYGTLFMRVRELASSSCESCSAMLRSLGLRPPGREDLEAAVLARDA